MADTENLAILLTDMVGFTERSSSQSRDAFHRTLSDHDQILKDTAVLYAGEWIKSTGDGMLVVFRSPTNAVQCGMAMQDALAEYNHHRPEAEQIHIRVAVNLGEVRRSGDNDIFGEAVNVTARIEALTPTDEVYFSQAVYLAMNKAEVPSEAVGSRELKGIPEPVTVYRVPAGEAVRLIASGEPMQGAGVPYPFGGMPHASVAGGGTGTGVPARSGRNWPRRLLIALATVLLLLFALAALKRAGQPARDDTAAAPSPPAASAPRPEEPAPAPDAAPAGAPSGPSAPAATPSTPSTPPVSAANLRRNDMFLVLSRTVADRNFFIKRHPDSAFADGIRLAEQNDQAALARLRRLGQAGDVEAMLTLGLAYAQGRGVPRSLREGARWLERAYATGDPLALWFRGMVTLTRPEGRQKGKGRQDAESGLHWIEQSARSGEPLGALTLGVFHANGEHVPRNDETAVRWLRKAAGHGLPFAESMLAGMYLAGRGVPQDTARAVALLESSAGKSDPTGQHYLGLLYERGHGVRKDTGKARRLFSLASEAGFNEAEAGLRRLR